MGRRPLGTRPLTAVEITANWDILRGTCLEWCGRDTARSERTLRDAATAAMQAVLRGAAASRDNRALGQTALDSSLPYPAVQGAVAAAARTGACVTVTSHFPAATSQEVLARCGYDDVELRTVPITDCAKALIAEDTAQVHVVMDSLPELLALQASLFPSGVMDGGVAASRRLLHAAWQQPAAHRLGRDRQRGGEAAEGRPAPRLVLHLCDWAVAGPRMQAQAAAQGTVQPLSDIALAQLLGVTDSDSVMDGITWR